MSGRSPLVPFVVACGGAATFCIMDAVMKGLTIQAGVFSALMWRDSAAVLASGIGMAFRRPPLPRGRALRLHIERGVVVCFMALAFFWGIARLPLAEAIGLSFLAPIIALILAAAMLGERIGRRAMQASVLGVAGTGVILAGRLSGIYDADAIWGAAAVILSSLLFAYNLILQKQQAGLTTPLEAAFYQMVVRVLVLAPLAPWLLTMPTGMQAGMAFGAGVLAVVSLMLFAWAYARAEAQYLIPVEYTAFVWAAALGWLFFDEAVTWPTMAGTALIVSGCLLAARSERSVAALDPTESRP